MSDRRCPECFEILECPACDPSITHMVHDSEFGGSLASVQPTPAAPQPECSLLLADGTICVKRAGHSDDHGMALRSTPAAPHQHRFDVVIRDDEHMRLLGCSNTPCEESYQWDR